MSEGERAIAWTALEEGTPVVASDGEEIGRVAVIIADEGKDIFSGISIKSGLLGPTRHIPAALIDEITPSAVRLTISSTEAEALEDHAG
ncbi:MAG: PRC-barrel domain-containing protein [Actinomycetota bacterium]